MDFYHLSHTDLDGYTCQYITKHIYHEGFFVNANYGEEVTVRIDEILHRIERSMKENVFFLITDLNLSEDEAAYLDNEIKRFKDKNIKLLLLDHHASGIETAEKFEWYHLDVTKSASKITYDYFNNGNNISHLEKFIDAVNAVDIWLQEDPLFEFGKVLMRLVDEAKEINRFTFNSAHIRYKHTMLSKALPYIEKENNYILLDDDICKIKKSFFIKSNNDTLDNLVTNYILDLIEAKKEEMTIYFQGNKGILTYGIQNSSIVGNGFLRLNPDYHFFMNVSPRGTFSLRADNKMDVSKMAELIAGGGGHPNASGGKLKEFKEFFIYDELKSFVEALLKDKE
ncbi:hypothetical protein NitYY0826_C0855 [Nitratiruptor sp. YY08-26]|uniref:DHH family phosphoesterase n=1 Tax=unclassified Nitratiruptor TaxID=2624044 RepID=UPI00191670AE|nr:MULTISPECIES: 3',5'-cyclic-nucleotide phosphodiesterase [unclassified Nitratiruptor]BCD61987.1 hypothetical protein NitYY0813_C0853 [Nitratiruptor sp. YY08-13]BCD65923.1 hypothetical protein NitYY0826_C0855 [Nitratiruptor sp. YY08-26]